MAKRKTSWREWMIFCEGVGPIYGTNSSTRGDVLMIKRHQWPDNDLYQVKRVRITLDEPKRASRRRGDGL